MKRCLILILILISSSNANSQKLSNQNQLSIELSTGYERTGLYNYSKYNRDGGEGDGNFEIVAKNGNLFNFKIKALLAVSSRNVILFGSGFTLFQTKANLINGWTAEVIEDKQLIVPIFSTEIGHRFMLRTSNGYRIYIENSVDFTFSNKLEKYNLKKTNLIWKPGIHLETPMSQETNLVLGVNCGLGLFNASNNDYYILRAKQFGCKIGIMKQM